MSLLVFCPLDLPIADRGVLDAPAVIVGLSVSSLSSVSFYFTCFKALLLDTCMVTIDVSSWKLTLAISNAPFSPAIFLVLKFALSDIYTVSPVFFFKIVFSWDIFFHIFIYNLPVWISCRQNIVRFFW